MRAIRKRCLIFAAFTGIILLTGVTLFVFGEAVSDIRAQILLLGIIIAGGIVAGLWIRELRKLKIARLIAENPILHIRTAVISDLSGREVRQEVPENTEVIVSYFGILLNTKIIKFNQDGIRLRAVEIGHDFISFTYGTEKSTQIIRLLRPTTEPSELDKIAEKFRYETGITPTLLT